ncbi:hypothetical protein NQ317_011455 [Molorchus minor]|uniref:C2H2-type domain-containing protein n=1 Tax=Molorchus minor TaxID=1323400 RepID=A0ABQ9IVU1_9CUCU|nr:hypothetical protein NQ317_011455 [Molorchus minor]
MELATSYESLDLSKYKLYVCPMNDCNAIYTKPCKLTVHIRKHTGERPFECDVEGCSSSYRTIAHMKRHKCLVHEKACEVTCNVKDCGLVFNNKYSLKKHYNRIHITANYPFQCPQCPEGFKKQWELFEHIYSHTGELPFNMIKLLTHFINVKYVKNFSQKKSNLKQHYLSHVEDSEADSYTCPYEGCERNYKYKKNLTYHIAAFHEKINESVRLRCTEPGCEQLLKSKKNLKQHLLNMHSGLQKEKKPRKPRKDKGIKKGPVTSLVS